MNSTNDRRVSFIVASPSQRVKWTPVVYRAFAGISSASMISRMNSAASWALWLA
jgi:hypothetical protein